MYASTSPPTSLACWLAEARLAAATAPVPSPAAARLLAALTAQGAAPVFGALVARHAGALARAIGQIVQQRTGQASDPAAIAPDLQARIATYVARAARDLADDPEALRARLALIVQAETQAAIARATAAAVAMAPPGARLERRCRPDACPACWALAGVHAPPYPAAIWATHPHCHCTWIVHRPLPRARP